MFLSRDELKRFIVVELPKIRPSLLLLDSLSSYFTSTAELYQLIKILDHTLHYTPSIHKVVLASSTTSLSSVPESLLCELISGQVTIASHISAPADTVYTVQGRQFTITEDQLKLLPC